MLSELEKAKNFNIEEIIINGKKCYYYENGKIMNVQDEISQIIEFRKLQKGKCVSTSHTYSIDEFSLLIKELKKTFKTFSVQVNEYDVLITIEMYKKLL